MIAVEKEVRPVVGYEGYYEVDNSGRVYSVDRVMDVEAYGAAYQYHKKGKEIKQHTNDSGYMIVCLCKDGKSKTKRVHRLVAEAFLPNPDKLPIINHKDENRTNNSVENLEWCTYQYNVLYNGASKRGAEKKRGRKMPEYQREKLSRSIHNFRIERVKNDDSPFDTCQVERLIEYLNLNGEITKKQATEELGIQHLASRILQLRSMGYKIVRGWKFNENGNGKYTRQAKYRMEATV